MTLTETESNQLDDKISTEDRILRAAEDEFLLKGYASARTTSIAEAAGVTHAMLHYYYRSKEKLFDKVISDKLSQMAKTFLLSFDECRPLADSVRAAVENHFDLVSSNPLLPRFMVCEVFSNPKLIDIMAEKISSYIGQAALSLQKKIDECSAKGECRPLNVVSLFMDIISLNVFPMLALPMMKRIGDKISDVDIDGAIRARREENVQTILRKLIP